MSDIPVPRGDTSPTPGLACSPADGLPAPAGRPTGAPAALPAAAAGASLAVNPSKAKAWVVALDAVPSLAWSGGSKLTTAQVGRSAGRTGPDPSGLARAPTDQTSEPWPPEPSTAWAAASRATGTRNGEHDT
jgi:hypothetical protein